MTGRMGTETPGRPLESLEWYRAAVRSNRSDERGAARILSWLKGIEFLTVHISVFAIGIVALIVINLLRSPDDLWVDRVGAAWALLLTIHGVTIGLIWAIGLLNRDDDEALQIIPDAEWRRTSGSWPQAVTRVPPATAEPTPPVPRATTAAAGWTQAATPSPRPPDAATADGQPPQAVPPGWSAWGQGAEQSPPPDEPKASWKEAASWLTRSGRGRRPAPAEEPRRDSPPPGGSPPT